MTDRTRDPAEPSELEGGGTEQTWGQGEGRHEPTIPDDDADEDEASTASYAGGSGARSDDPDQPLSRDDEGMEPG